MNALKPGLYDTVVTEALQELLRGADIEFDVEDYDPVVLAGALAKALAPRLVQAFEQVGKGDEPTERQVELANQLVELLGEVGDPVAPPARPCCARSRAFNTSTTASESRALAPSSRPTPRFRCPSIPAPAAIN